MESGVDLVKAKPYEEWREDVMVTMAADRGAIVVALRITDGRSTYAFNPKHWPAPWQPALQRFLDRWSVIAFLMGVGEVFNGSLASFVPLYCELINEAEYADLLAGTGE